MIWGDAPIHSPYDLNSCSKATTAIFITRPARIGGWRSASGHENEKKKKFDVRVLPFIR